MNKPSPDPDMEVCPDRRDFTWDCGPGKRRVQVRCGMDRAPVRRREPDAGDRMRGKGGLEKGRGVEVRSPRGKRLGGARGGGP